MTTASATVVQVEGEEISFTLERGAGHPWSGEGDWDLMLARSATPQALQLFIAAAQRRFWLDWLVGTDADGLPSAVLYKPGGATAPWTDPGPNGLRSVLP